MKISAKKWKELKKASQGVSSSYEKILIIAPQKSFESRSKIANRFANPLAERIEKFLAKKREDWKSSHVYLSSSLEKAEPELYFCSPPDEFSSFELLEFFRNQLKASLDQKTKSFAVFFIDFASHEQQMADCLGAALAARIFLMPSYGKKAKEAKKFALQNFGLVGEQNLSSKFEYGFESGEGTNRVRYWGSMPPNFLNPEQFGKLIRKISSDFNFTLKFYSKDQLEKMGAGAFTAVDRGNPDSKGGIYEIIYNPRGAKNKKPVTLVGKGLCFDTGGYDIKTGQSMISMKGDMQGAAVAFSSLIAAASLKWPLKMKAVLGVTENHISPKSYKADEVVIALNGTSIEVVNTDAEGRMVLADTLSLATREKPDLVMDFATLTGMAVYAIGKNYAAGFTNTEEFHSKIIEAGRTSGERVWTFPLDKDYGKSLESSIADTLQCSKARGIDHILAAIFLQKFVENDAPWVHIDLAAAEKSGGLAHTDTEFTGFGVRWTLEFLKNRYRLKA